MRTVQAPGYEQAWHEFADPYEDVSHGIWSSKWHSQALRCHRKTPGSAGRFA